MLSIIKWFSRQVLGKIGLKIEFATGIGCSNLCLQRQKTDFSEIPLNSFFLLSLLKDVLSKSECCLLETQTKINREVLKHLIINYLYNLRPDLDLHSLCAFAIGDDEFPPLPQTAILLVKQSR